jgi:putative transposase
MEVTLTAKLRIELPFDLAQEFIRVSFSREVKAPPPGEEILGGDRGLRQILTATDGKRTLFFGGRFLQHQRRFYRHQRASVQSRKAHRPTRSIRRLWKRLRGREGRFQSYLNHCIAKKLVAMALASGCSVALEDLTHIRERGLRGKKFREQVHSWAYHQLQGYIEYKARQHGIEVAYVDPAYTSQGCSRCGYTHPTNRYGLHFRCGRCGLRIHADLNGARNVRLRGILQRQAPLGDGAPSVAP